MNKVIPPRLLMNPVHCLSLGFGSGLSPKAPGTLGTLVAVLFYLPLRDLDWSLYLGIVFAGFLLGIWLCQQTADALGVHDHPGIVWDEVIGYWLTMFMAPKGWLWILLGFILFRLFDIWKPWPIRSIDQTIKGGLGIMLDDILAALYALMAIQLTSYLLYT